VTKSRLGRDESPLVAIRASSHDDGPNLHHH